MKKHTFLLLLICVIILCHTAYSQTARIEIDESNSYGIFDDKIPIQFPVTIVIRYTCDYECTLIPNNAFKIYSPDGAYWSNFEVALNCLSGFCNGFDEIILEYGPEGNDGPPVDDCYLTGSVGLGTGWVTPFDDVTLLISFIPDGEGSHICLDIGDISGSWVWNVLSCNPSQDDIIPDWGGPYCFEVFREYFPPDLSNPPPGDMLTGNHCDGFTYDFDFIIRDPHLEPPSNTITHSCNIGDINSNGVWTWVPGVSYEGSTTYLVVRATTDMGAILDYECELNIDYNTPLEFMSGYEQTCGARPGVATQAAFYAIDFCPEDPMNYFVEDDGGCAGSCYFTDSILTFIPDESDCALSPITMIIGVEDTQDTSRCEIYFHVIPFDCCVGYRGDANCSGGDPDIADITRLIDFLYLSSSEPLCCPEEADANASGGDPDIADITKLIDFLYLSHEALPGCP